MVPSTTARIITGSRGFTSPISAPMIRRPFRLCCSVFIPAPPFHLVLHLALHGHTAPAPSESGTASHMRRPFPSVPREFPPPRRPLSAADKSGRSRLHWPDGGKSGSPFSYRTVPVSPP